MGNKGKLPKELLTSFECSTENRVKRELLKTSEGMKTIYQVDADELQKETGGVKTQVIQSPQE